MTRDELLKRYLEGAQEDKEYKQSKLNRVGGINYLEKCDYELEIKYLDRIIMMLSNLSKYKE